MTAADVIIIGSGIGGSTMAASLAATGRRILVLERGDHLRPSPQDRDDQAIFVQGHYRPDEHWLDGNGQPFNPGNYYNVGGNSKFYGAVMLRYRQADFAPIHHMGGSSRGWPITYDELEPFYSRAEQLFAVRGRDGDDPSAPPRSASYPHEPVPQETAVADLAARLRAVGLHPSDLPLAVDLKRWLAHGQTPWDAFPDTTGGKLDAESAALKAALAHDNVRLQTGAKVTRLIAGAAGRITGVELASGAVLEAPVVVLAAGAVQSAALLLASANEAHPNGLANRSDQVGRNFMNHNCSALLALHPLRRNPSVYQKTLMVNDFYLSGGPDGEPLGNMQMLGKVSAAMLQASAPLPGFLARWIAARSLDIYAMSEDLPDSDSRVTLRRGQIVLDWKRSNWAAHELLVKRLKQLLRRAGYPLVLSRAFDRRTPSHQCGTARMGVDPSDSVVDAQCRSHDHPNLYVTDASVLPTSAAVNPALTIAALSMRTAAHIAENHKTI